MRIRTQELVVVLEKDEVAVPPDATARIHHDTWASRFNRLPLFTGDINPGSDAIALPKLTGDIAISRPLPIDRFGGGIGARTAVCGNILAGRGSFLLWLRF